MARRVLLFPLTRLLIGLALFLAARQAGDLTYVAALGRSPSAIADRAIVTAAAFVVLVFVGAVIERRRPAELGFPRRSALRDLGLGLVLGTALLTAIVGLMALFGWYQVSGFLWNLAGGNAQAVAVLGLLYYGLVAVSEEVLFRGFVFRIIEEGLGTWPALAFSAAALRSGPPQQRERDRLVRGCDCRRVWHPLRRRLRPHACPVAADWAALGVELLRGIRVWYARLRRESARPASAFDFRAEPLDWRGVRPRSRPSRGDPVRRPWHAGADPLRASKEGPQPFVAPKMPGARSYGR
jgi:membrane protease YdiL (CAAX protease family)